MPRSGTKTAHGLVAMLAAAGAALTLSLAAVPQAAASPTATSGSALALTPPMGWNDWAHFQCGYTESTILANARALVSTGLAAKGYNTVTTDDCWMQTSRDANGNLQADPSRFPDGMAYVGQQLHALGLKFGIYEDAGTSTCGGYAGSWGHWQQDANLFASWGVDYLKLDGCNVLSAAGQSSEQTYQSAYQQMSQALKATGRPIVFSESAPAYFEGTTDWNTVLGWVGQYGQLWREGYDIATYDASRPNTSRWSSVLTNYGYNNPIHRYESPGNWNDPDFLIAGDGGLTSAESRSQLSLWAEMGAPMILSDDVTQLSAASVADLGNSDVIAVDQDSLGHPGYVVSQNGTLDVLTRPLANGDRAVAVLNRSASTVTANTTTTAAGFAGGSGCTFGVKDLWSGATSTTSGAISASVPAHGTALLRITPSAGCGTTVQSGQVTGIAGQCLDDSGSGTADGNPVIVYGCTGNPNQRWTLPGDGTVRTLGKCLDVPGSATTAGTYVDLRACNGSAGQQWSYAQAGNLVNPNSGDCLDVYGGGSADGTKVDIWPCGQNQFNQTWSLPQ
ncbi:glycoside hydrolase family 27 protein [Streptacidiphilus neutrinimicus]|uniref:glycoside hydrolase family 27 protein n=1 Tax=Streptacidiphilus neutrinimicus TaxID=105420 RepID=UPI0007C65EB5|nr:glycoside hydrolase family 27 protein [Streptacidiphilus neutrinimicus]